MAERQDAHADVQADSDAMALGPIDVPAWSAAAVGVFLGLLVVLALTKAAF